MEQSLIKNNWSEILDQVDDWWEELTDDDLEQINGSQAQLVYFLQERYSYSHEAANAEVEKRVSSLKGLANPEHSAIRNNGSRYSHNWEPRAL
jgi:uncharacterized protein YjbJ (UPF0337 family)